MNENSENLATKSDILQRDMLKRETEGQLIAVRLSAFQKELEEAANEPLFDDNDEEHSDRSEILDVDEVEEVSHKTENKVHTDNHDDKNLTSTCLTNSLNHHFATPLGKKNENKVKFTPSLTKIQERGALKNSILQTPNNSHFNEGKPFLKDYFSCPRIKEVRNVSESNDKIPGKKLNMSVDDFIEKVGQMPLKEVQMDDKKGIKKLRFNDLLAQSTNEEKIRVLHTPKVQYITNKNLIQTGSIQKGGQKSLGNFLSVQKQSPPSLNDEKEANVGFFLEEINAIEENNKENKLDDVKLQQPSKELVLYSNKSNNNLINTNGFRKSLKSSLQQEKKYLESLNESKTQTQNQTDMESRQLTEEPLKLFNEESKSDEKQLENKFCMVTVYKEFQQFDGLVVNKTKYIILNELGKGGSSVVYDCYDPVSKTHRAIKKVNLRGEKSCVEGYINEVKVLHKLQNCDRIIKMYSYEIIKPEKVLYMVLDKGDRDLSSILKDLSANTTHLPIYMLMYYWMEMLFAVKQIHENGIIHSDLKPANFLVVRGGLKLIDFGIASAIQTDMTSVVKNVQIGSFNYISPEALNNNSRDTQKAEFKISYKSDVWSLGCILYQLVYGKTPFQHIGHMYAKLSAILDPEQKINYPEADWVPSKIISTIKECLRYDMKSRPSVDELIKQYNSFF